MFQLSSITTQKIKGIYRIYFDEESIAKHVRRKTNIMLLSLKGTVVLQQGRRKRHVTHDNIGLIPQDTIYKIYAEKGSECIIIEFISDDIPLLRPDVFELDNPDEIINIIVDMEEAWSKKIMSYVPYCLMKFYQIIKGLSDAQAKGKIETKHLDIIAPSLRYIEEHFTDHDISNEIIAKQSEISVVYFRKIFTAAFHVSPMKYVQNLRMEKAKELLLSGLVSVTDVARLTGFSSIYSFSKTFKTACGCSPLQFGE